MSTFAVFARFLLEDSGEADIRYFCEKNSYNKEIKTTQNKIDYLEETLIDFISKNNPWKNSFSCEFVRDSNVYGCFDPFWNAYPPVSDYGNILYKEKFYFCFSALHPASKELLNQINSENEFLQVREIFDKKSYVGFGNITCYTIDFSDKYSHLARKKISYYIHHLFRQLDKTDNGIGNFELRIEEGLKKYKPIQMIIRTFTGYMGITDHKVTSENFEINFNNYELINKSFVVSYAEKQTILTNKFFLISNFPDQDLSGKLFFDLKKDGNCIHIYRNTGPGRFKNTGVYISPSTKNLLWSGYVQEYKKSPSLEHKDNPSIFFNYESLREYCGVDLEKDKEALELAVKRIMDSINPIDSKKKYSYQDIISYEIWKTVV